MSDPSLYVKCYDSLARFTNVIVSLPGHLEEKIGEAIDSLREDEKLGKYYKPKIEYIERVLKYLETRV